MKHSRFHLLALLAFLTMATAAHAAITYSGSVVDDATYTTSDPNTWTAETGGLVGLDADGQIDVSPSSTLLSNTLYLGLGAGFTGTLNIDGDGSAWDNASNAAVGQYGAGVLNILNDAAVSAGGWIAVGLEEGSTGTMIVDDSDLSTGGKLIAGNYGTGTLEIRNGSTVLSASGRVGYQGSADGTATLSNSVWNNTGELAIGAGGSRTGTLTIEAGGQLTNTYATIGHYAQAEGTSLSGAVTVTDSGSRWDNSSYLIVGRQGEGSLDIRNGAVVTNAAGYIGYHAGGIGSATVSGTGSQWTHNADYLLVGRAGQGTLLVENGGVVDSIAGYIGVYDGSNGDVTVTGAGSQWNNTAAFYVSRDGGAAGTLTISDGGSVTCRDGYIGQNAGSSGTVTVTGSGSSFVATTWMLAVGNAGTGVLNINDGAEVITEDIYVDLNQNAGSSGTINFDNGTLNSSVLYADFGDLAGAGTIYTNGLVSNTSITFNSTTGLTATIAGIGADGNVDIYLDASTEVPYAMGAGYDGVGSLTITDGVVLTSWEGDLGFRANSNGTATVSGNGTAWMVENEFDVGREGAGILEITDGGLVRVDGTLRIDRDVVEEIGGAVADSFINMTDGGMLAVQTEAPTGEDPIDPTTLLQGDITHIRWWDDSAGDWAPITTATLDTDYTLEYVTEGEGEDAITYALLTVGHMLELEGDLNGDGLVGSADLDIVRGNWGMSVTGGAAEGDPSGDGVVGSADLDIVRGNWGNSLGPATVPEPSVLSLLLCGLVWLAGRKRR